MIVEHESFGVGKILNILGREKEKSAIILFENSGEKQLFLKYAKLKVLKMPNDTLTPKGKINVARFIENKK